MAMILLATGDKAFDGDGANREQWTSLFAAIAGSLHGENVELTNADSEQDELISDKTMGFSRKERKGWHEVQNDGRKVFCTAIATTTYGIVCYRL